jgi:glycosyltransferase involved in cell wall biosynthesis
MKIALFGGVFGSAMADYALSAPEVVLRRFLTEAGHEVAAESSEVTRLPTEADVYHAHHFGPSAFALALGGVEPFVFTSHNPFLVSDLNGDESRLDRVLQQLVLRTADAVVALSRREAELLSDRFGVSRDRFVVIPNGLDLSLYGPGGQRRDDALTLLSVGQLTSYKGHIYLLEAMAQLVPRFPGLRATIVSHVHDARNEVVSRVHELGLGDRVEFAGPFDTRELIERYRTCDVFVQPSLAECFPVTVLEAMACARPVVVTDVGGVAEEVGAAGTVVPPADPASLAAALESLLANPELREARGKAAYERVRELYDGRRVADEHVRLYESLDRRKRPAQLRRTAAAAALELYRRRGAVGRYVPTRVRRRIVGASAVSGSGSIPSSSS